MQENTLFAQTNEIKKTEKTTLLEGKKYYLHRIEKGQTLYGICNTYSVEKNDLILENPELINGLKEGQEIKIPVNQSKKIEANSVASQSSNTLYKEHVVEPKQTLYAISKLYSISIEEIIKHNPEAENGLKSGQTLKIPQKTTPTPVYHKPEKKQETLVLVEQPKTIQQPVVTPTYTSTFHDTATHKNNKLKIGVLLPFHLSMQNLDNEANNSSFEPYQKSVLALDFYQGLLLAADSLTKKGLNFDFYTYDTGNDSLELAQVLAKPEMQKMDLLIGPVYNERLLQVAAFSKKYHIPMVSPFSQVNKFLLGNSQTAKIVASASTQFEAIGNYILKNKKNETVYLLTDESPKEKNQITLIKRLFKDNRDSIKTISVKTGFANLEPLLNDGKPKIFITPINDQPKVTEMLGKIYFSKDTNITIYGTDNWFNFSTIETERMAKINVVLPTYSYVNYARPEVINFVVKYKNEQGIEPSKYAFQGFDTGIYFLDLIAQKTFNKLENYPFNGLQNQFDFYQTAEESGYENKHAHLLSFKTIIPVKIN